MKEVQVVTDSCALLSDEEKKELDVIVTPVLLNLDGKTYRDEVEMSHEDFYSLLKAGAKATTSQPYLGDVIESFKASLARANRVLHISISEGLSGTYQNALMAARMVDEARITVLNSKTICGAQRYLVQKAARLAQLGKSAEEIMESLKESLSDMQSFLIAVDFSYIRRSGRLSKTAAIIGSILRIKPVLRLNEDGTRIEKYGIARTMGQAVDLIIDGILKRRADALHRFYICHGDDIQAARAAADRIRERIRGAAVEILLLSPTMAAHGGPGCITVHHIKA
ncbi:MAG TPA: DegV family protein [Bacillota bacterium]|nr:DegV family protein [Bacillota bacterium]HOA15939.1 DegV family protein [Bacillota bacterium]